MKALAVVFFLMLVPFSVAQAADERTLYDVAIFVSPRSVWQAEVDALHKFFEANGLSVQDLTPAQINAGSLFAKNQRAFRTLVMPGGLVGQRSHEILESGRRDIRTFISSGGDYVGICAGAAFAACGFKVAMSLDDTTERHVADDYVNIPYKLLELWPGSVRSPYEWAPFQRGGVVETVDLPGSPRETRMYYHAGPAILQDFAEQNALAPSGLEIWGYVRAPNDGRRVLPPSVSAANKPAIVKFNYGSGRVVLFAHHPVIPVDATSDRTNNTLLQRAFKIRSCESVFSQADRR